MVTHKNVSSNDPNTARMGPLSWAKTPCIEPPRDVRERASLTRPGRERVKYRGKVHARDLRILAPRGAAGDVVPPSRRSRERVSFEGSSLWRIRQKVGHDLLL